MRVGRSMGFFRKFFKQKDCRQNPSAMVVDETNKPQIVSYPLHTGGQYEIKSRSSAKSASSSELT